MRRVARPLLLAGTVATVLGLGKAHAVVHGYDLTASSRFAWSLAYIVLLAAAGYAAGLPELPGSRRSAASAEVAATMAAAGTVSIIQLVLGSALLPRFVVLGTPLVLLPFAILCWSLAADGRERDRRRDRVVLVAGPDEGAAVADELDEHPERPAELARRLDLGEAAATPDGRRPLVEAAEATGATTLVLDRGAQADASVVSQAAQLHEAGVRVRTLSLFYDEWLGKLPVGELERISLMFDIGELHRVRYGRVKRIVDSVLATVGLGLLAMVTPLVLAGNRLGNRGPLLYRQERVGKGGRTFTMLKFRTMTGGEGATTWTSSRDPRLTPFGAWMRRTHLDELPQVVNILSGHLAVVGPRPEQPRYVAELEGKLPFYGLRHLVRPGLTGWAQVRYPYGATEADALEKLQYEFYYLRHQSLALDLRIIGRTLRSVVGGRGR